MGTSKICRRNFKNISINYSLWIFGKKQEIFLENWLKNEFPTDIITEVPKGIKGADILHKIIENGKRIGVFCIESKNTKQFQIYAIDAEMYSNFDVKIYEFNVYFSIF